jgi:gas vesicle protein GvpL/GvpF
MALRVYGVVMQDGQAPRKLPDGTQLTPVRELAAVQEEGDFSKDIDTPVIDRHLEVVEALFAQDAILPTPVGTVFRSTDVLQRWMELHYVALSDALAWVENRLGARVHVTRARSPEGNREAGSDLGAVAAEVTRSLRRHAVSTIGLRHEEVSGILTSAAFLVERELWDEFKDAVEDEREKHPLVNVEITGPWPPYDFVRMQFGS